MQFEQFFASAIEVAIATAGFSGIVVVLGQRGDGAWSQSDLARVSLLLQASFVTIFLSFLPLVLNGADVPASAIWRIGSACFIAYSGVAIPLRLRAVRRIRSEDPTYSPGVLNALLPVALLLAGLQAYNVIFLGSGWPFALTILFEIAIALLAFVRLLRTLWERSAA